MILSVDTGINNFGLTIFRPKTRNIVWVETIQTERTKGKNIRVSTDYERRIALIARRLEHLFRQWKITGVVGELPTFGSKSASAAVSLTAGSSIILTLCESHSITPIWKSPREIKKAFTGNPNAEKKEIMKRCCALYGWRITERRIKDKRRPEGFRMDPTYHVMKQSLSAGYFEHIADAIAAYYTCMGR